MSEAETKRPPSSGDDVKQAERHAPWTDELRDAVLAETLEDVAQLHRSMKDLVAITEDTDGRMSARMVELRTRVVELQGLTEELAGARGILLGQMAMQASAQSKLAFKEELGELLGKMDTSLQKIDRQVGVHAARRFIDLLAVGMGSSLLSAAIAFWFAIHH